MHLEFWLDDRWRQGHRKETVVNSEKWVRSLSGVYMIYIYMIYTLFESFHWYFNFILDSSLLGFGVKRATAGYRTRKEKCDTHSVPSYGTAFFSISFPHSFHSLSDMTWRRKKNKKRKKSGGKVIKFLFDKIQFQESQERKHVQLSTHVSTIQKLLSTIIVTYFSKRYVNARRLRMKHSIKLTF